MKRTYFLLAVGLMCHAALPAQTQPGTPAFQQSLLEQQAQSLAGGRRGGGIAVQPLLRTEAGKPFSATVTTQTTQTLLDGTHVNQTTTMMEYRDAEGRVRTEPSQPAVSSAGQTRIIVIRDPVAGVSYSLDPANKSALKLPMAVGRGGTMAPGTAQVLQQYEAAVTQATRQQPLTAGAGGRRGGRGETAPQATMQPSPDMVATAQALQQQIRQMEAARTNQNEVVDDLGTMTVNGVPAHGTRITTVVPVGAIGNDREFRSVSERWFSSDLNLLVKSINADPRFGATTYELTNISRQPPDPSLFQVPADYNIVSNGGRQPQF